MRVDVEQLRKDLKDYYGTAMCSGLPMAMMELAKIEKASEQELVRIAQKNRMNMTKYNI